MTTRLITLRQIQAEKLPRSRSWIFAALKAGRFPSPLDTGGCGPNLWEEDKVDAWLEEFVSKAKMRATDGNNATQRSTRAQELVEARRLRNRQSGTDVRSNARETA